MITDQVDCMDEKKRDELIDNYYRAVDNENYAIFDHTFSEDASHIRPGQGSLNGRDDIRRFFKEERQSTGTTHDVKTRFHGEEASYCKVNVSGEIAGSMFNGDIISEFEFDPKSERISKYRVYRGYQR